MRVPLSWLGELVPIELTPEQLAERLTLLGMEVSAIDRIGSDWQRVVVGELLEVRPHPGSSKLSLTRVRVGDGEPELAIVCGATNIAAGQRVPVALPGAVLPGDRRIEVTTIAGAESQGMLCSGDELGLTDDADGILILEPDASIGLELAALAGDVVLDIDVKPNRGDALSILGLAREVAAATGAALTLPDLSVAESGDRTADHVRVTVEDERLCSRFVARYVDGVTVGPSPWDVQRRLIAAGQRPVSNVVDASNYVMLELGKPVHTFDAAAVADGAIDVRLARAGERLETLDHEMREVSVDTLLISDVRGPLAIAGVMGGAASEVSETTTTVIIESAIFDPVSVRRTAFRYALRSEASLRFEKGQDHGLAAMGADRTAALISRWAGGRVAVGIVDTNPTPPPRVRIAFRPARVDRALGEPIAVDEQRALLARVGVATEPASTGDGVPIIAGSPPIPLAADEAATALVATVPPHRRDLHIEADLVEEIARVRGYETIRGRLPDTLMPALREEPRRFADEVRSLASGMGLDEVVTHGLVGPEDHARLGLAPDDPATIRAANPVTLDHSELRRSLLPGHLRVLVDNERQRRADVRIFEVGALHRWDAGAPLEWDVVGLLLAGADEPLGVGRSDRDADVPALKGLLEALVERLSGARLVYAPTDPRAGVDHPGRTAVIAAIASDGTTTEVGRVGELHPALAAAYDVRAQRVVAAELSLAALAGLVPERRRVGQLEHLPAVERDLAFVVGESVAVGDVEAVIRELGGPSLRDVRLFDRYAGPPLEPDERSLAFRLRYQAMAAGGDQVVDASTAAIVTGVSARLGGRLRA
jgi:phenylalanyl-tRNA synthetase beta chain